MGVDENSEEGGARLSREIETAAEDGERGSDSGLSKSWNRWGGLYLR